jgi:DNA-binding CsgD family transcriptional regulator
VPTAKRKSGDIQRLLGDGLKPQQIAAELGIGIASVYRYRLNKNNLRCQVMRGL